MSGSPERAAKKVCIQPPAESDDEPDSESGDAPVEAEWKKYVSFETMLLTSYLKFISYVDSSP